MPRIDTATVAGAQADAPSPNRHLRRALAAAERHGQLADYTDRRLIDMTAAELRQLVGDVMGELLDAQSDRPRYLTEVQTCEALQISRPTLRKLDPPCIMVGDHRRYDLDEVAAHLRSRGAK